MSKNVSDIDTFYKDFGITSIKDKESLNNQQLHNLYKKPIKDKGVNMPHFQVLEKNLIHQADILYLPHDNGYKYALVVVDSHDRSVDAEPLKEKDSKTITAAFKKIYSRKILKEPQKIEVDNGTEFKGETKKYFEEIGVAIRTALPGRHRMQAMVERKNQEIGTALSKRMTAQELLTGEESTEWIEDLQIGRAHV